MGNGIHAFIGTVSGLIFCYFLVKEGLFSEEMPASFAYIGFGLFFGGLGWAWDDIDEQQPLEIMKNKTIQCKVCKSDIKSKSDIQRYAKGMAGAGTGGLGGAFVGTLILPGTGTIIGALAGGAAGSTLGVQESEYCKECCEYCENKKTNCDCMEIVGNCLDCGKWLTKKYPYCNCKTELNESDDQ